MRRREINGRTAPRLFEPGELMLRPSGVARLRALARRPAPRLGGREKQLAEDERTMRHLRSMGRDLCLRFGLRWAALKPERDGVTAGQLASLVEEAHSYDVPEIIGVGLECVSEKYAGFLRGFLAGA